MGSTTNETTSPDTYQLTKTSIPFLFLQRIYFEGCREGEASDQNGTFPKFPPLDSVQPADPWETAVRRSTRANTSLRPSCSGALPDFLLHHTGDGEIFIDYLVMDEAKYRILNGYLAVNTINTIKFKCTLRISLCSS